jgi:PAS domain S-box-containing protein
MFGRQLEEMLGHSVEIVIPPRLRIAHKEGMARFVHGQGGRSHVIGKTTELSGLHVTGYEFPVEIMLSKWENEGETFFSAIIRDISERKRIEREIKSAEKRSELVIGTSPIAISIARLSDGRFLEVNDAFLQFFGRGLNEVIGKTSVEIGYWPDLASRQRWLDTLRRDGEIRGYEASVCNAAGDRRDILISSSIIDHEYDACALSFIHDITDRKKYEEALKQSNAELESFAYISSHDLREPLRNVALFSGLLERKLKGRLNDDEKDFLKIVNDGAKRMDSLIQDILAFSRVGRRLDQVGSTEVAAAINKAVANMKGQIDETGTEITIASELPVVRANPSELESLFQNLIANAMKYRAPETQPRIVISCQKNERGWHFHVQDNGIGLEPGQGYEKRIFALFQRLHQRDEYGGGTGVGLAICKKIVERYGGQIWAESPGLNQGTSFFFSLPC